MLHLFLSTLAGLSAHFDALHYVFLHTMCLGDRAPVLNMLDKIYKGIDENKLTGVVFLDLKKALTL